MYPHNKSDKNFCASLFTENYTSHICSVPDSQDRDWRSGVPSLAEVDQLGCSAWRRLEKRGPIAAFQYRKGLYKKDRKIFAGACSDRMRGNSFSIKECRFRLDIKKTFFYECGETLE